MRIRKNTKLSSVLLATAGYSGERPQTYVCLLNQSPWDVIPVTSSGDAELTNLLDSSWFLPPSSSSSSPPLIHQFNGEDRFDGNVSLGDCNVTAERFNGSSLGNNRSFVSVLDLITSADNYERSPDVEEPMDQSDYSDKKSKSVEPNSPLKTSGDDEQVTVTMRVPPKRGRPRGTGKKAPGSNAASTNPYEFYYYSGFGPRWGRKRNGSSEEKIVVSDNIKSLENNVNRKSNRRSSSSSDDEEVEKTRAFGDGSSSLDGFDYMEEDNGVESDDDHHVHVHEIKQKKDKLMMLKKRGRKPVKERSLKSLM